MKPYFKVTARSVAIPLSKHVNNVNVISMAVYCIAGILCERKFSFFSLNLPGDSQNKNLTHEIL